ncbi:MAG: glycosyltransferase family protein [Patescibacteria group bacterium]|nr:glycosyltransferase family protein [Patescibacteria group bacterium]
MARTVAIIQARMGSTRLPGKILKPILGEPMLARMLERVKRAKKLDAVVVATTDMPEDDATAELARKCGVAVFRGSEKDVLDRFYRAAKEAGAEVVMRLTGDCPLMDPAIIDAVTAHFQEARGAIDYCGTPKNCPEGLDTEVFTFAALEEAAREAKLPSEREHVTPYIKNHPERFKSETWEEGEGDHSGMHWSVDTQADFDFVSNVFEQLYPKNPSFSKDDILSLLVEHPELLEINKGATGYEGLAKSLKEDEAFKKHSA